MTLLQSKYQDKNLTEFYKHLPSDKYAQSESSARGQHQVINKVLVYTLNK